MNKPPVVNITVAFSHKGHHFDGVAAANGVGFELVDAPCGAGRQLLQFTNCANAPTGIIWDGVTAVDDKSAPVPQYLLLKPDVKPA
jgi:hypothetical protein